MFKRGDGNFYADNNKVFVCTELGFERTLEHIKHERAVNKPIPFFEQSVPISWVEKGYVVETDKVE